MAALHQPFPIARRKPPEKLDRLAPVGIGQAPCPPAVSLLKFLDLLRGELQGVHQAAHALPEPLVGAGQQLLLPLTAAEVLEQHVAIAALLPLATPVEVQHVRQQRQSAP